MFGRNRTPKPESTPEELRQKALDRLHTMAVSGRVNLPGRSVSHRPSIYRASLRALVAYGAAPTEIAETTMTINGAPTQILSPDPPRKKWHQRWSVGLALLALAGSIGATAACGMAAGSPTRAALPARRTRA